MTTSCPHCGANLTAMGDAFCSECHHALDEAPANKQERANFGVPRPPSARRVSHSQDRAERFERDERVRHPQPNGGRGLLLAGSIVLASLIVGGSLLIVAGAVLFNGQSPKAGGPKAGGPKDPDDNDNKPKVIARLKKELETLEGKRASLKKSIEEKETELADAEQAEVNGRGRAWNFGLRSPEQKDALRRNIRLETSQLEDLDRRIQGVESDLRLKSE